MTLPSPHDWLETGDPAESQRLRESWSALEALLATQPTTFNERRLLETLEARLVRAARPPRPIRRGRRFAAGAAALLALAAGGWWLWPREDRLPIAEQPVLVEPPALSVPALPASPVAMAAPALAPGDGDAEASTVVDELAWDDDSTWDASLTEWSRSLADVEWSWRQQVGAHQQLEWQLESFAENLSSDAL